MRTKVEFLKEIMGPRYMADAPKLELTLHEANMIHRKLIKTHQQAQRAYDVLLQASREAQQAAIETCESLSNFEAELLHFQEKNNLTEMQKFTFVTKSGDDEDETA